MADIKHPQDMVNLVNITGENDSKAHRVLEFHYDSEIFVLDKFIQVPRYIANHGILKTSSMTKDGTIYAAKIVELPEGQRTREGLSKVAEELEKEKAKSKELQETNNALLDENKSLREKVDKLEKRLARA